MNEIFFKKIDYMYVSQLMFFIIFLDKRSKFLQLFFGLNSEILYLLESPNHSALDRKSIFLNL